jgi:hypothetical protein
MGHGEFNPGFGLMSKTAKSMPPHPYLHRGRTNVIADVPSWSFGSNPAWKCESDNELQTLFNSLFPIPEQNSWTIYLMNCELVSHVTSIMQTQPFELDESGGDFQKLGDTLAKLVLIHQTNGSGLVP